MKKVVFILGLVLSSLSAFSQSHDIFTDPRDGKTYKTVKIGYQWIMAENLAYEPPNGKFWAYKDKKSNIEKYGYLYNWKTANKVAPDGWHLPSIEEWEIFYESIGGTLDKINESGLDLKRGGVRHIWGFGLIGKVDVFWSSTYRWNFYNYASGFTGEFDIKYYAPKKAGCSVRLFKNLNENEIWEESKKLNTIKGYNLFIKLFPNGSYIDSANVWLDNKHFEREVKFKSLIQGMTPDEVVSKLSFEEEINPEKFGGLFIGVGLLTKDDNKNEYNGQTVLSGFSCTFEKGQLKEWHIVKEELRSNKFHGENTNNPLGLPTVIKWSVDGNKYNMSSEILTN